MVGNKDRQVALKKCNSRVKTNDDYAEREREN